MTTAPKKIFIAITCLSMAASAQLHGNNYSRAFRDSQTTKCDRAPCSKPTCNTGPYCGPNCYPVLYCGEFNVKAELLYWIPTLGGLETAFGTTQISTTVSPGPVTTTRVIESDREPHSKWSFGYRVGADVSFNCFDIEADWTHYNGQAKHHKGRQHGHWKIRYDIVDLIFGRRFCIAPCFYFKPFIGVRGANIAQSLKSHLLTFYTGQNGSNTVVTNKHDKERFWGIGPEFGLEANWYLGWNFSIFVDFDVVTYYGNVRSSNYDVDTFTTTVSISDGKRKHWFNNIGTDGALGIRWDKSWDYCNYAILLMLKANVEQHRIYDFSNLGSDGTLSLDGAAFAAGLGVRY